MARTAELDDDLAWEHLKDLAAQQADQDELDADDTQHIINQLRRQ